MHALNCNLPLQCELISQYLLTVDSPSHIGAKQWSDELGNLNLDKLTVPYIGQFKQKSPLSFFSFYFYKIVPRGCKKNVSGLSE